MPINEKRITDLLILNETQKAIEELEPFIERDVYVRLMSDYNFFANQYTNNIISIEDYRASLSKIQIRILEYTEKTNNEINQKIFDIEEINCSTIKVPKQCVSNPLTYFYLDEISDQYEDIFNRLSFVTYKKLPSQQKESSFTEILVPLIKDELKPKINKLKISSEKSWSDFKEFNQCINFVANKIDEIISALLDSYIIEKREEQWEQIDSTINLELKKSLGLLVELIKKIKIDSKIYVNV